MTLSLWQIATREMHILQAIAMTKVWSNKLFDFFFRMAISKSRLQNILVYWAIRSEIHQMQWLRQLQLKPMRND